MLNNLHIEYSIWISHIPSDTEFMKPDYGVHIMNSLMKSQYLEQCFDASCNTRSLTIWISKFLNIMMNFCYFFCFWSSRIILLELKKIQYRLAENVSSHMEGDGKKLCLLVRHGIEADRLLRKKILLRDS